MGKAQYTYKGNTVIYIDPDADDEDVSYAYTDCYSIWRFIGLGFHQLQQLGGKMYLNGTQISAVCMCQTNGGDAYPVDYVETPNGFVKLGTLFEGELRSDP